MNFIPMRQCDLTKTDATTVVAYRLNKHVSENVIRDGYVTSVVTGCRLSVANEASELILNKIFGAS